MARNLYRMYLYIVFLVMLVFAAVGLAWLLQPLLALTPLRGPYSQQPTNMAIVQGIVFFGISWLVAALLGGLHYWLIRRDMRADPDAGNQGVRAFFLNVPELIAAPLGIGLAGGAVIANLGQPYGGDLSYVAATAIAALTLWVALELVRRGSPASKGVALFFQRLYLYGVQFTLLNILAFAWIYAFTLLVNVVAFGGQASGNGDIPCAGFVACTGGPNLFSALAATLWMVVFWLGFGWLARSDAPSLLRRVVLAISFAYGIILFLVGIDLAIALLFRDLFGVAPSPAETLSGYNFSAFLALGLLVSAAYLTWLSPLSQKQPVLPLVCQAIIAALMAGAFFWGIGYLLLNALEAPATPVDWASALALVLTGAAYVVIDTRLRRSKSANVEGAMDARRGFIFALLGASILAVAIGGATALYTWITALLGSPLDSWPHTAHIGLAAFIVGAFVLALYFWQARREQLIGGLSHRQAHTTVQQVTIEDILDELLAGKLTRDMAASRIRALNVGGHP